MVTPTPQDGNYRKKWTALERSNQRLKKTIKQMKDVAWTGDGRFDSVGHSAKYGVYNMFCTTIMKIVHFELVQVSEYRELILKLLLSVKHSNLGNI